MNTERRKFLKTLALGGGFLLLSKILAPLSIFTRKRTTEDNVFGLNKRENSREVVFSDDKGNKVLVVEK